MKAKFGSFFVALMMLVSISSVSAFKWPFSQNKGKDNIPVQVKNHKDCPVKISAAHVRDVGTKILEIREIEYTYDAEIQNLTDDEIRSVQLLWVKELPFADYLTTKFKVNSTESLEPLSKQFVTFRLPFDDRADSFYHVWVKKVLFADGSIWSLEEDEKTYSGIPIIKDLDDLNREFESEAK